MTKTRWWFAWLMFAVSFVSYMDRVNFSVATPEIMKEFGYGKMEIGWLQTAFFAGYALMQIPGGMLAEYFGHRRVVSGSVLWWSVFTVLTAVPSSFPGLATVRCLFGMGEGPVYPAFNNFIGRWFPSGEKARASSFLLSGSFIGPVFGPAITVALMLALGWRSVFVIFGVVGVVVSLLWYRYVKETPGESPLVNTAEKEYIEAGAVGGGKKMAPWSAFMRSRQFWAIGIQYFITDYIMFVFLAWLPLYLMEAQKFSLQKMGWAAALPWAMLCGITFLAGYISDRMVASGVSKNKARTIFGIAGLLVCCVTLYLAATAGDPWLNVLWLTVSLGALGFTFNASWAACHDIGGAYAGSVAGWMNFWGNVGGVLAPIVTAWVATTYGWQAAITFTSLTALVGVAAWVMVKPDQSIQNIAEKKAV